MRSSPAEPIQQIPAYQVPMRSDPLEEETRRLERLNRRLNAD